MPAGGAGVGSNSDGGDGGTGDFLHAEAAQCAGGGLSALAIADAEAGAECDPGDEDLQAAAGAGAVGAAGDVSGAHHGGDLGDAGGDRVWAADSAALLFRGGAGDRAGGGDSDF